MFKNILLITLVALMTVISQIFLKKGLKEIGELRLQNLQGLAYTIIQFLQNKFIIFGVIIAAAGAFFWLLVISKLDLTTAFPISGGIFYILLFIASMIFLGEKITIIKILGVLLIFFGIYFLS